jgi:predicted methyltransferase
MKPLLAVALLLVLSVCPLGAPKARDGDPAKAERKQAKAITHDIKKLLKGDWRSEANADRDRYRHPAQTLAFFGIRPDMTVIEIWPGAGWYSEILAPYLRAEGRYVAAVDDPAKAADDNARETASKRNQALRERFAAQPKVYGRPRLIEFSSSAPELGPPESADAVLTFRNVHNWVMAGTEAQMFEAFFEVLKPGGVLGVVDHRAADGAVVEQVKDSGYLPEQYVIALALKAGFRLDARSEINANPDDLKNYPDGVWTLPPTLRKGEVDREKYLDIGESDRMTLRFVKPAE